MKVSLLRMISIAVASLMASSSIAFAAMDMDARVTQLENQMKQVRTETAMGTYGAKTATARPEVDGRGLFIVADLLRWHPKVGGTEYAYSDQDKTASLPIKGRTKDIDFKWDYGVRVGVGYNFDHDNWDARLQYTWFDSSGSDSTSSGLNSSIVPLRGSSTIVDIKGTHDEFLFCTSAKSQYDFDHRALDFELGRAYFVSGELSFRPHWGVKSAWFDLQQIARYTGGTPVTESSGSELGLEGNTVHIQDDCDFWGVGPRTGIDSRWSLGYGFSIFGNVSGALLYGYFDVDHKEKYSQSHDARIKLHANRHAFSPTAQFQLGLRYDEYLHDNRQHLGVALGYEAQYWWRQNQALAINDADVLKYERYSEDVSMHGITLGIKWDF